MIERGHPQVSILRQCELLKLSRSSVYYVPRNSVKDLDLMYLIDQQHLETPYYGSRKMRSTCSTRAIGSTGSGCSG